MISLFRSNGHSPIGSLLLVAMLFIATTIAFPVSANAQEKELPEIPYILVDTDSGKVLAQNRAFERWHPASLTKLMTAYVTFRAIAKGEIGTGSPVTITKAATAAPPSRMGYREGVQLRVDTAVTILIVKSANDVAVALAESVAGSVPDFVGRMNFEARRLGMSDTNFVNPNGLHDTRQYVSARDMVRLSKAIWNEFPQYQNLFETPSITTGEKVYYSYNLLLERFPGTSGMKTGFVCASGYNIVASAEREGRRLLAVVLGADSQTQRAVTAAKLLLSGFREKNGIPLESLSRPQTAKGPSNMRNVICSKKAREARYDPAAENAVINSPFLEERKITKQPVPVRPGGIDQAPSEAWLARAFKPAKVPVPTKRPDYAVVDINGEAMESSALLRGSIPIPTPSPLGDRATQ